MKNFNILIGAGGHAKVILDILSSKQIKIDLIVAPKIDKSYEPFKKIEHHENDDKVLDYQATEVSLINGLGFIPGDNKRKYIYEKFTDIGYKFLTIISNDAIISETATICNGVQIFPGSIINANSYVGSNSIINSGSIIGHDSKMGDNSHIAPGATIAGNVVCEDDVFIGAGATIINDLLIGRGSLIGAGSMVNKNILSESKVFAAKPLVTEKS